MDCKNCNDALRTDYSYCPSCGAKVIRNRITAKNLFYDFTERFFNLDNTFLKTFLHLFTKPHLVIGGYIEGTRKKYLNPVAYITIALTLSGILLFLLRKVFYDRVDWASLLEGPGAEMQMKTIEVMFDFNTFIFLLYIPILAIAAYFSLNKKEFYLSEYVVVFIYILAHYSILTFPISLLLLIMAPSLYLKLGIYFILFILFYSIYVLQKLNGYKKSILLFRSGVFSALTIVGFIGLILFLIVLLFATGIFSLSDFTPKA